MEIILIEDLKGVGTKGSTVNVKPGFARNYLLPRRLAIPVGTKAANLYQELERQKAVQVILLNLGNGHLTNIIELGEPFGQIDNLV